jgi:hypothetical protein
MARVAVVVRVAAEAVPQVSSVPLVALALQAHTVVVVAVAAAAAAVAVELQQVLLVERVVLVVLARQASWSWCIEMAIQTYLQIKNGVVVNAILLDDQTPDMTPWSNGFDAFVMLPGDASTPGTPGPGWTTPDNGVTFVPPAGSGQL